MEPVPTQWVLFERLDREVLRRYVQTCDIRQLVDEHAANPFGPHSVGLATLLNVLRRQQGILADKHVIVEEHGSYHLGQLSGARGGGVRVDPEVSYASREEAEHAVFVRRLNQTLGQVLDAEDMP